jgi:hypothetical protein
MTDPDDRSTDPMTEHEQPTAVYDDEHLEWDADPDADEDAVPARPRRRLLTPVTGGLVAVILVAGGFVGGVEVQKRQGSGSAASGLPAGVAARLAGGGSGAGGGAAGAGSGAASSATVGTVANVKGSTLYVTGTDGTTVKVRTRSSSKVTRNAASTPGAVHPGDTVVVQGDRAASGTITATSVTATAKGVSAGGPGAGAFRGAGGSGTAAGAGAGAASGTGSGAGQVPQGFAPPAG